METGLWPAMKLSDIEKRLLENAPYAEPDGLLPERQAAVAVVLRLKPAAATEILFIRRAVKEGDPWSGHMAFPGGHKEPDDNSLLDAAIRETWEEVGIDLRGNGRLLGALEPVRPMPGGPSGRTGMLVAPFVFSLKGPAKAAPNYEVAEVVWTPLHPILQARNHVEEARLVEGSPRYFSGYQLGDGKFVWGLTYRMLHNLFEQIDPQWRPPPTPDDNTESIRD
jgi:8-oxo-dGTP pyrophosphatase MutT (NUDIX family)